jgi:hypothetical protein
MAAARRRHEEAMTDDELKAFEARATAPKWPALLATLRDTAVVLSRFVRKKGDQNVIDQLQAAADEVEALRADSTALVAEVRRAVEVIRAVLDASDLCQGHADCAHSMKPWFDARELLYQFDNEQEALANLRLMASHERYR